MADINSSLPVTDTADGSNGSAVPTKSIQIAGSDGVNLRSLATTTVGQLITKDLASGVDGATLPTGTMQVGGMAPGNILQAFNTDVAGNIIATNKIPLTPGTPATFSVTNASTSSVAANTARKGLIITNISPNVVSLNVGGGTAVLNSGITLYPGWVWYMDEYSFTTSAIFAIASVTGSAISIQEFS